MPTQVRAAAALALAAMIALPAVALASPGPVVLADAGNQENDEGDSQVTVTGSFTFDDIPAATPITISPTLAAKFSPVFEVDPCTAIGDCTWTFKYSPVDDLDQLMTVTATDTAAATATDTFTIKVNNTLPYFYGSPSDGDCCWREGQSVEAGIYYYGDDGGLYDPLVFEIDCGDGSGFKTVTGVSNRALRLCKFTGDGPAFEPLQIQTFRYRVTDDDGGAQTIVSEVGFRNEPPVATMGAPRTVVEGSAYLLTMTDPKDPSAADQAAGFAFAFMCDSTYAQEMNIAATESTWVAPDTKTSTSASKSCTAVDGPDFIEPAGAVGDKDRSADLPATSDWWYSGWWITTRNVTVTNARPGVGTPTFSRISRKKVRASLSFTDAGILDTHTCDIDWGDGNTSIGTVIETNGAGSCAGEHKYARRGRYVVRITITDSDDGERSASAPIRIPVRR